MQKLRVGVLMGGKSIEHEVSFNSGRTICDHLDIHRYDIIPLYQASNGDLYLLPWHFLHRGKTSDFLARLAHEAQKISYDQLKNIIDFMYIALHGRFAEDGTLQGMLEILKIPYLGSKVFGSAIGLDKALQRIFLQKHGIEVPNGLVVHAHQIQELDRYFDQIHASLATAHLNPPLVIKPHKEGSSLGISIIFDLADLPNALQKACSADARKLQDVLIEEKIDGMEFCCIILTDYKNNQYVALPVTEIVPEPGTHFFDYDQKYMPGRSRKITPARCSAADMSNIQNTCIKIMKALDFTNLSRTDGFLTKDGRVLIIDSNTLTGTGPSTFIFHQAAQNGMNHTKLINHLIETELHNYGMLAAIEEQERKEQEMNETKKIRVAVLLGGTSNEKEISVESGRNIVYKLSPHKYEVTPLFVNKDLQLYKLTDHQLVYHATFEIEESLKPDQKIEWSNLPSYADFVFIGLHGGVGENGCVQGMLEMLDLPYNGSSVLQSALCMDKYKTTQFLKQNGFHVPDGLLISKCDWETNKKPILDKIKTLSFPLIAKPHDDGCSVGVSKIKKIDFLETSINAFFASGRKALLIEECISGMELTVGVIGNTQPRALPPSQAVTAHDILTIEEKFLPGAGENQTPAPLPAHTLEFIQKTIEDAYKIIGLKGYARIDCFYQTAQQNNDQKERVIILEVNTLPALTPATCLFAQAAELGIKPMEFIDLIVDLGLHEWNKSQDQTHEPQIIVHTAENEYVPIL